MTIANRNWSFFAGEKLYVWKNIYTELYKISVYSSFFVHHACKFKINKKNYIVFQ